MNTASPRSDLQTASLRRQLEQFFEATTDAIFFLDHEYRFTFLNRHANALVSSGRDLIGLKIFEEFPDAAQPESPFRINYTRSMERRVATDFEAFYGPPLNAWFRIQSYPVEGGVAVFFRDITQEKIDRETLQRKTAEAERQHAEIETIYRTAPIGLALFDLDDYHYLRLNDHQAAFFGLTKDQMLGRTVTELAPIPGVRELFDQVARGEPVINYPLEGRLINDPLDEHRYWTVSYFPVYGPDGSIQAISAASLEITQQKKAEQALIQSEKLAVVGRLASSIAHEINNPLESVTNLLYLASHSDTLEQALIYVHTAEVELRRASAITAQTLRFHKQATSPHEIDINEVLSSVLSVFQGRILNGAVRIEKRWASTRHICAFGGEIRQVISNLISNALDAMPNGGTLYVRARDAQNWKTGESGVIITIADSGTGISASTLQKIFNPFFTTKGQTGTGLGLWVSKEIIDRHRGSLQVRSCQNGALRGTVFNVFLPCEAAAR